MKLPMFRTLGSALREVGVHRRFLARAAIVPVLLGAPILYARYRELGGELGLYVLSVLGTLVVASFAYRAHRRVLGADTAAVGMGDSPRGLLEFLGWASLGVVVIGMLPTPVVEPQPSEELDALMAQMGELWLYAATGLGVTYCVARGALVFPRCAVGRPGRPDYSWRLTRGSGWRIVIASVLVYTVAVWPVFFSMTPSLTEFTEDTMRSMPRERLLVLSLATQASLLVAAAVEAAFLSLAFLALSAEPRSGAD